MVNKSLIYGRKLKTVFAQYVQGIAIEDIF